ncbi:MAG: CPBP family intramembrane metalloprotease [Xanthomonadaceae bacterium]|nr:CPBP family intramembrane metalloprotease [Xanthomonadaceae bacterium]MDE1962750.1 CPBP family intramembrane metalloprotease [Xanthomonadaceae bacterium]
MGKREAPRWRAIAVFAVLFVLYQSAEGVGQRLLHSDALQAALMIGCVAAAWPLSRWLGWRGYGAYALDRRSSSLAWLGFGLAVALIANALAILVGERLGVYAPSGPALSVDGFHALAAALPMLALSTFVPSIAEDILARGFWYRAAGIHWRRGYLFVAFSAGYFLLNHVYRLGRGPGEWLMILCMGIAYATALCRAGTLWAAVGLHWGWNFANGVFGMLLPADTLDVAGSRWLIAGVHLLVALLVVAVPPPSRVVDEGQRLRPLRG